MIWLLLMLAAPDAVAQDRAEFEDFWSKHVPTGSEPPLSKDLAWKTWEWGQAQFSLGFCSSYIQADEMEKLRRIPSEEHLMKSDLGRFILNHSNRMFREGMNYRSELPPSRELCQKELDGRAATLNALN